MSSKIGVPLWDRIKKFFGLFGAPGVYPSVASRDELISDNWAPEATPGDTALAQDIFELVAQCRDLDRRSAKARAIGIGFRADVVGSGIGVEPIVPDALADIAARVRDAFYEWAEHCGVSGESLWELQWTAAGEVVVAGQSVWRWVVEESGGAIPLRLLPLEVEWFSRHPLRAVPSSGAFIPGVELDRLGRPVAYHLLDPLSGQGEVVPATDILHAFIRVRATQHLGEPLLAPLIARLMQDERLIMTELKAAVNSSAVAGVIESTDADLLLEDNPPSAPKVQKLRPGGVIALKPGERWQTVKNDRPSQQIGQFRATIDGDLAGGAGLSRQWLDRDTSRANYSSMREDNLRTTRALGPIQQQLGRVLAGRVYERVLPFILLSLGLDQALAPVLRRYELRPDRLAYVDPQKEAEADVYLIAHSLATQEEVLAAKGKDFSSVLAKRQQEQAAIDAMAVRRLQQAHRLAAESGVPGVTWRDIVALASGDVPDGGAAAAATPSPSASAVEVERDAAGRIVAIRTKTRDSETCGATYNGTHA